MVIDPSTMQSAPVASTPLPIGNRRRVRHLVAITVGSALEQYDFTTFTFFAVYIGYAYFPSADPFASLMLSLGTLAAGFIMRPLGGALIGRFADIAGRKQAMLLTIVLMTIGTVGVAATPSYAAIGIAAPVIVVISRVLQGIAFGGEVGAATAFVVELAPPGKRHLYLSVLQGSAGFGIVLAGAIGAVVASLMTQAEFAKWGWRIPFLIGLLAVPAGLYIRRHLPETLHREKNEEARRRPASIWPYVPRMVLATLALGSMAVTVYISYYLTTYSLTVLKLPAATSISVTIATGMAAMVGCAIASLADRYGEQRFMLLPRIALIVISYPLFLWLYHMPGLPLLMLVAAATMLLQATTVNATLAMISQRFPMHMRSVALGLCFALATSLFGGTAQLVAAGLTEMTGNPLATTWYLIGANVVGLAALLALYRMRQGDTGSNVGAPWRPHGSQASCDELA